jgi:hypothetical protein
MTVEMERGTQKGVQTGVASSAQSKGASRAHDAHASAYAGHARPGVLRGRCSSISLALAASLCASRGATAEWAPTLYYSYSAWKSAIGGSQNFDFEFPEMEESENGFGAFRDQYASYGFRANRDYAWGMRSVQPHLPSAALYEQAWGLDNGGITPSTNSSFDFAAPINGLAMRFVGGNNSCLNLGMKFYRGSEYLGPMNIVSSSLFQYGNSIGPGYFSKMIAFQTNEPFDRVVFYQYCNYSLACSEMFTPLNIPAPSAAIVLAAGLARRRRAR